MSQTRRPLCVTMLPMSTPHGIRMIDVGGKAVTPRTARASARLRALPETIRRIQALELDKGDAIATARLAGIMAAKRTSDIVPLCHPLPLDSVDVSLGFTEPGCVIIEAVVAGSVVLDAQASMGSPRRVLNINPGPSGVVQINGLNITGGYTFEEVRAAETNGLFCV